ncbi:Ppx/GppA family phosphatase [Streptomyces collinus]|uniref:Ppx/GppA phosphatase family protein n=1 Tax=Streptomyces collinus TaxID=42684 RepID=UPI0033EAE072
MRLGVLEIGSNTVRLAVADEHRGVPLPVHSSKRRLRLAEKITDDGRLPPDAVEQLVEAVDGLRRESARWGVADPLAVATAAVRGAANQQHVVTQIHARTGLCVNVVPGDVEAGLTFLAARNWVGAQAGSMVLLDIGGGSLEIASGRGRTPGFTVSLPLGVARLTREYLDHDTVPAPEALRRVRRRVRHELRDVADRMQWERPRTALAASRTFHQLGRLCGAAPSRQGVFVPRELNRHDLKAALRLLAERSAPARAELPGISHARARQCLTGAIIAHTAMRCLDIGTVVLSPWECVKALCSHNCRDAVRSGLSGGCQCRPARRNPGGFPSRSAELPAARHLTRESPPHEAPGRPLTRWWFTKPGGTPRPSSPA